jgi:hypothetical protein
VLAAAEEPARPALDSAAVPRALPLITKRIAPVAAVFLRLVRIKDTRSIDIASDRVKVANPPVILKDMELPLPEQLRDRMEVSEIHSDRSAPVFPIVAEALECFRPDLITAKM